MRDGGYRTQEEIDSWKERDPIGRLHGQLVAAGFADEGDLAAIRAEVERVVAEAAERARNDPWPDASTVLAHVYAEGA
jgi:pyruvate dehydrogenase E1 component alpha subunit